MSCRRISGQLFYCKGGEIHGGVVKGTGIYTSDSDYCKAARHSGVIASGGGYYVVQPCSGLAMYTGSNQHGILTSSCGICELSFTIKAASKTEVSNGTSEPFAQCWTCSRQLTGAWVMSKSSTSYEKTGRYLGISDGYFLHGNSPYWVYCYCYNCWQTAVKNLPFLNYNDMERRLASLENENQQHKDEIAELTARIEEYEQKKEKLDFVEKLYNQPVILKLLSLFSSLSPEETDLMTQHGFTSQKFLEDLQQEQLNSSVTFSSDIKNKIGQLAQAQILKLQSEISVQENLINQFAQTASSALPAQILTATMAPLVQYQDALKEKKARWETFINNNL